MIRPLHRLLPVLLAAWPAIATADDWARDYPAGDAPALELATSNAGVTIAAWAEPGIRIEVHTVDWKIGRGGLHVSDAHDGDRVTFVLREPVLQFHIGREARRVRVDVHVPARTRLDVRTSDGAVAIDGVTGETSVHTGDGAVDVRGFDGTLHVATSDGAVWLAGRFDAVDAGTSDGAITVDAAPGSRTGAGWRLHTSDGRVELRVPDDLRATLDVRTSDGAIDADLPVTLGGRIRDDALRADLNGGGGTITVRTSDGPVRLARHDPDDPPAPPARSRGQLRRVHRIGH